MRFSLFSILIVAAFIACTNTVSMPAEDDDTSTASSSSKKETVNEDGKSSSGEGQAEECVGDVGKPWNGTTAKEFACGAGTKLSPYIILTAEQLAKLSFIVGSNDKA